MTKTLSVVLAAFCIFSLQPCFARAADPYPAGPEKLCELELRKIQAHEDDREMMLREIQRLHDEIRRLNETLNNIRSQIGHGEPAPTSR